MKVYVVEWRCFGDTEVVGVYTSAAVAEKYIVQSIQMCYGKDAKIENYRDRYFVSIEDVVSE